MLTRRSLLTCAAALLAAPSAALAFEVSPYDPAKAKAAIAAGKSVVIHVYADWCPQCHAQKAILSGLEASGNLRFDCLFPRRFRWAEGCRGEAQMPALDVDRLQGRQGGQARLLRRDEELRRRRAERRAVT